MIVTDLLEHKKNRIKVFLDGEAAFVLYKSEIRRFKIEVNSEISDELYAEIQGILRKRAKLRAMDLLRFRDYSAKQLRDKLTQSGYGSERVEEAIRYATEYHYIDDHRYAKNYIEYRLNQKSRRKLEQELVAKGIDLAIISSVFDELSEEGQKIDEISMIIDLMKKKKYRIEQAESKEMQKMYGFLARKGFSQEAICKVLFSKGKELPYT